MELAKRVKELALGNDIDYVGIAPASRFENAPNGHKPVDLLPGAASVVSMGIRISKGVQLSQRIAWADKRLRHVAFTYMWFGYGLLNMYFLDRAAFGLTRMLEQEGYVAVPIVASGVEPGGGKFFAPFSNRHAAVAAGLGEIGWNGLCLTPDVGPKVRFVSVITTAKLEPDSMYNGPKLCNLDKCRELGQGQLVCVRICPVNAFGAQRSQEVVIGGRKFDYALLDKWKCAAVGMRLGKKSLGSIDVELPEHVDARTVGQLVPQRPPQQVREEAYFGRGHGCGLCLLMCPVGSSEDMDKVMEEFAQSRGGR